MEETAFLLTTSFDLAVGLGALLLSIPPIARVERTGEIETLYRWLRAARPKLVVLDGNTTGDGIVELLAAIKRLSPHTRHIVLSDTMAEVRRLTASGVKNVTVKGIDPRQLVNTIEQALGESTAATTGGKAATIARWSPVAPPRRQFRPH